MLIPISIGIFYLDRNAYVKKFQNNRLGTYLISLNKKYDPIMVKVLKKKGFSASIRKVAGSVPYRVQVGTYRTKKAANKVVKKLKAAGFQVLVKSL